MRALFALFFVSSSSLASPSFITSAELESARIEEDFFVGVGLGVGLESQLVDIHLRAPAYLRVVDLSPSAPTGTCGILRCADWLAEDGTLDPARLSRVLAKLRLGDDGSMLRLRGGPLRMDLGKRALVDGYLNSPVWDARQTGLALVARADALYGLEAEAFIGGLFRPEGLLGGRAQMSRLVPGTTIGLEGAVDLEVATGGVALDADWRLLDDDAWKVAPFIALGVLSGPRATGVGALVGTEVDLELRDVLIEARADVGLDSPGHRTGFFYALHEIDRTLEPLDAPGGLRARGALRVVVFEVLAVAARYRHEAAQRAGWAEVSTTLRAGRVAVDGRAILKAPLRPSLDALWAAAEARVDIWGPFTARARYARTFRAGAYDDDVFVGVVASAAFGPRDD